MTRQTLSHLDRPALWVGMPIIVIAVWILRITGHIN
jgi:hypothetical protein